MKLKQQLCEKCRVELRVLRAKMNKMAAAGASVFSATLNYFIYNEATFGKFIDELF